MKRDTRGIRGGIHWSPELKIARNAVIAGVVMLTFGVWLWSSFIFNDAENTFWAMLDANLQTRGVTRQIKQTNPQGTLDQYMQLQLGDVNAVEGVTTIDQKDQKGKGSRVITRTIGTPDANYSQYTEITTSEKTKKGTTFDFEDIKNVWGKEEVGPNSPAQSVFSEMVFGVVPFGNLPADKRQELIDYIRIQKVYEIDYRTAKVETINGQRAYRYKAIVKPSAYIAMLQEYDKLLGLKQLEGIDANSYSENPPIELELVVVINARQLRQVTYAGGGREENYSGYGAHTNVEIPGQTVPRADIERKLQKLLQ